VLPFRLIRLEKWLFHQLKTFLHYLESTNHNMSEFFYISFFHRIIYLHI
jgi:hypothetical protein